MADPFVAEIRIMASNFAPTGWAFCDGQIMPISQNTALFSLLGTMYGGDGRSTFALPNLQGAAPMFWGQGPGLSPHFPGESGGSETVALIESEIPAHNHTYSARPTGAVPPQASPVNLAPARSNSRPYAPTAGTTATMGATAILPTGSNQPHNNMMPYLTLNFVIALQGVFPPRS